MKPIAKIKAPDMQDILVLAQTALERLPAHFREKCKDITFRVDEFPSDETCDAMGLETPFDILGLYHGTSLTQRSFFTTPAVMDTIYLYRRPILDFWAEGEDTLEDIVTHVLIHEIGHHFGFSDEDMEQVETETQH